jgi:outer membrane protein
MKKLLFVLGVSAVLFCCKTSTFAVEPLKIGYINAQELIDAMPESDSAKATLDREAQQYQSQLETMQVEYNNKLETYVKEKATYSEFMLQTKEEELGAIQQRIQSFQTTAQQELQRRNQELLQPILDKAKKAIEDVAAANGFTYILDSSAGILLYTAPDAMDILPLVKTSIGLK